MLESRSSHEVKVIKQMEVALAGKVTGPIPALKNLSAYHISLMSEPDLINLERLLGGRVTS